MKETFTFKLTRPAKSSGGDRYDYGQKGNPLFMAFYVPQELSRVTDGVHPAKTLKITIEEVEGE